MAQKTKKAVKKAAKKAAPKAAKKAPTKAAKKAAKKAAPKAAKKAAKKPAAKKAAGKSNTGLFAPLSVSPALADVIGSGSFPRTEIVKKIWDYIKKNKLQDSANKRMINADAKLKTLFAGKSQISMFDLAKVVSSNVK
jgi:upstream activation factor subunit UAF30